MAIPILCVWCKLPFVSRHKDQCSAHKWKVNAPFFYLFLIGNSGCSVPHESWNYFHYDYASVPCPGTISITSTATLKCKSTLMELWPIWCHLKSVSDFKSWRHHEKCYSLPSSDHAAVPQQLIWKNSDKLISLSLEAAQSDHYSAILQPWSLSSVDCALLPNSTHKVQGHSHLHRYILETF